MALNWTAFQFLTGAIICDLPGLELGSGPMQRSIGQMESTALTLNLDGSTPPEWVAATEKGSGGIVAWSGDPSNPVIKWGGVVTQRVRDPFSPTVQLSLSTPEAHLASVPVGTLTTTDNQDTLVADLMAFATGANMPPWVLTHVTPSTQQQTVAYIAGQSNISVLAALQSLSAYNGGPEWVTGWQWNVAAGTIVPTFTYGSRIGQVADPVLGPMVVFEADDMQAGSAFTEDYSAGFGANQVTAMGAASGSSGSTSATATAPNLAGRPIWNLTYTPSVSTTDAAALGQFAYAAVTQLAAGSQTAKLVVSKDLPGKTFGSDWGLGDDIGYIFDGPAFPQAISKTARCVSCAVDLTVATPMLQGVVLP